MERFLSIRRDSEHEDFNLSIEVVKPGFKIKTRTYANSCSVNTQCNILREFVATLGKEKYPMETSIIFGKFGDRFAGGAVKVRFSIDSNFRIMMTTTAESNQFDYNGAAYCDSGSAFMFVDPASLDGFLVALEAIAVEPEHQAVISANDMLCDSFIDA